jgi:hypothetical protein
VGLSNGSYSLSFADTGSTTEHIVRVTGLQPDTKYFYQIAATNGVVFQGAADNFFRTSPENGNRRISIAAFGDCVGERRPNQALVLAGYNNFLKSKNLDAADAMLILGDNAYSNGQDDEYGYMFFDAYGPTTLKNHKLFPAPGNHDYASGTPALKSSRTLPYHNLFTVPQDGSSGGVASNKQNYYSYNIGNIHFISLDSYGLEADGTDMGTAGDSSVLKKWINADLAANTKKWVIVYWHHPPFTKGGHDSDIEPELINIRKNFVLYLESKGVDMILTAHAHQYERSYWMKGFEGTWASFDSTRYPLSLSNGSYTSKQNCPYTYNNTNSHGTVYVVSGNSSPLPDTMRTGFGRGVMPFSSLNTPGMFYFEVEDNRLDASMLKADGTIQDRFTILKGVNSKQNQQVPNGTTLTLPATWPAGSYTWNTGASSRSITVTPPSNSLQQYTVTDQFGCVTDTFVVNTFGNCGAPTNLQSSSITATAALLGWTPSQDNNSFDLDYKSDTASSWTSLLTAVNQSTYSLSGLLPSTRYKWRLRANCAAGSTIFMEASFTTMDACGTPSGLAVDSIGTTEARLKWNAVTPSLSYKIQYKPTAASLWTNYPSSVNGTSLKLTGLNAATSYDWKVLATCVEGDGPQVAGSFNTLVVCDAPLQLSSTSITPSGATLAWQAVANGLNYSVNYRIAGAVSWTQAASATSATQLVLTGLSASTNYEWQVKANCANNTSSYSSAVFSTLAPIVCSVPTGMTTSNITSSTATFSWATMPNAASYRVDYKKNSSTTWTTGATAVTTTSFSVTGLTAATAYNWRVRTNCSTGTSTAYAATVNFTTGAACGIPTGLVSSTITNTSASLSWTAVSGAASYAVEYQLTGTTSWIVAAAAQTTNNFNLTGLIAASSYSWRVKTNCTSSTSTYATGSFTTAAAPSCALPTALQSGSITESSALLSWTATANAASYTLEYKPSTSTTWALLSSSVTGTSFTVNGLSPLTSYDWRLMANCATLTSSYAASSFTTLPPPCSAPSGLTTANIAINSADLSWTAAPGAVNYKLEYKLTSSTVWTLLDAAYAGTAYTLAGLVGGSAYDWRVTTNCASNTSSSVSASFTTIVPPCNAPTTPTSSAISSSGATISWSAASGASSYRVEYKASTSATWIVSNTATTALSLNLAGLTASTNYDWRVMTNCTASSSAYVASTFATIAAPACPGTLDTATNGTSAGAATIPFNTDVKGMINPRADLDYYKFVLTNGGSITVTLSTLPANFDLQLFKGTTQVASSAKTGTTSESIVYTATAGTYYVRVNAGSTISNAVSCYTLRVAPAVGTFEAPIGAVMTIGENYSVKVTPNPVKDRLMVNLAGTTGSIHAFIFNAQGQVVKQMISNEGSYAVDVSNMPQGIYLIKMSNGLGQTIHSSKFIKQ